MEFTQALQRCKAITDVFELVKRIAQKHLGVDQAGLMVGLADLGAYPRGYIGAFYAPDANTVVVNRKILERIKRENPDLYYPYLFHVLLHEYIHSLGVYEETETRLLTRQICGQLGDMSVAQLANGAYFPKITEHAPPEDITIEYISGIDRKNTDYIN